MNTSNPEKKYSEPGGAPLVVHIVHRLAMGGLENGVINLINKMPFHEFRHAIICLSEATEFRKRIQRQDVICYELHKKEGLDITVYLRLWKLLRALRPDIVHTRNLGTLDCQLISFLAGINCRVHGEHGRDSNDLDGKNRKNILLRRILSRFVDQYIALSKDISGWLMTEINVPPKKISQIYNGVDADKFTPGNSQEYNHGDLRYIGTVGRLQAEKNQQDLVRAFQILKKRYHSSDSIKLVIVGDGPDRDKLATLVSGASIENDVIFSGTRDDIDLQMRRLTVFVLPSLTEGVSNTILEAMATALPVVATHVGGNPELIINGVTGCLVPPGRPDEMADAIDLYITHPKLAKKHGRASRERVLAQFSMNSMVSQYADLYHSVMFKKGKVLCAG